MPNVGSNYHLGMVYTAHKNGDLGAVSYWVYHKDFLGAQHVLKNTCLPDSPMLPLGQMSV